MERLRTQLGRITSTACLAAALCAVLAAPASATNFVVANNNDSGAGSLREAILLANADGSPPSVIDLTGLANTITLLSPLPGLAPSGGGSTTITGPVGGGLTISGNSAFPVFAVVGAGNVTIQDLTVANGAAVGQAGTTVAGGGGGGGPGLGGGLYVGSAAGTVTIVRVTFSGNSATGGAGGDGGPNGEPGGAGGISSAGLGVGGTGGLKSADGGNGGPPYGGGGGGGNAGGSGGDGAFGSGGGGGAGTGASVGTGGAGGLGAGDGGNGVGIFGNGGGGGGAGLGGAIYVEGGATVLLVDVSILASAVAPGAGGDGQGGQNGAGGEAAGSALFMSNSGVTHQVTGGSVTVSGIISDQATLIGGVAAASLTKTGAGRLILTGANDYSGGTQVSAGTLEGNTTSLQGNITDSGLVDFNQAVLGTYTGNVTGTGALQKTGVGTLILTGANTYSGGTTISAGILQGNTTSLQGNILDSAALTFNQTALGTYAGDVSGTGSLTKIGAGTLIMTGTSSYTGGTTVSVGLLQGDSDSLQGNIVNNAGVVFDQPLGGTYDEVISGTGTFRKQGVGVLTLNALNTYTGTTTIAAGTLQQGVENALPTGTALTISGGAIFDMNALHATIGSLAGSGNVINNSGVGTLVLGGDGSSTTYSGVIAGTSGIQKLGGGVLTLSGLNTYTGGTAITAGTLRLGVSNALSSSTAVTVGTTFDMNGFTDTIGSLAGAGNVTNNNNAAGLLTNGNGTSTTFSGVISGTGGLTKQGTGTLTLSGANTYTGATLISTGTLQLGASNVLPNLTALTVNGTFDMNGFSDTIGSLAGSGNVINNDGAGLFTGGNNASTTFSGGISGTGGLTKQGTGTLTLSGINTYGGGTTVSAGLLQGDSNSLQGAILNNAGVVFDQALAGVYDDNMSGTGTFRKQGVGVLTLSGINTYTGTTTIAAGTLQQGLENALPTTTALTISGGATFDMNNFHATVGSLAGSGNVINNNSVGTLVVGGDGTSTTFSGVIAGDSGLEKVGGGVFTLSGLNTYTGETTITAGTLRLGIDNALSDQTAVTVGTTFDMNGFTDTIGSLAGAGNVTNNNNAAGLLTNGNGTSTTFSGVISGTGGLTKQGTGTLTLSGANTYTGATLISTGTLQLGASNVLPNLTALTVNGTFDMNGFSDTIGSLAGGGVVVNGAAGTSNLVVGGNNASTGFSGSILLDISLTKQGTGTMTLSGLSFYLGPTTIAAGTLRLGDEFLLPFVSDLIVTGTFDMDTFGAEVASLSGAGSVIGNDDELITNGSGASTTFSGTISGTGDLVKIGEGTLTLSGLNTYTGVTDIAEGTLLLGRNNALSSMTDVLVTGTFDMNGFTDTIGSLAGPGNVINNDNAAGLLAGGNGASTEFSGVIDGSGGLTKQGEGTLTLSGMNTYTGATLVSEGTLRIGTDNALGPMTALTVTGGFDMDGFDDSIGSLAGSGEVFNNQEEDGSALGVGGNGTSTIFSGTITGDIFLTKIGGGTLTLTGANNYTGGTLVSGGTLAGTTTGLQGPIENNAIVRFDQTFLGTFAGDLTGTGSVNKLGTGTVIFTGANNYAGGTTISAGTLQGNTTSLPGNFTNNASLVFDQAALGTYGGVISGTGSVTKQGVGTLQLTGSNTYTGTTTVLAGVLQLGANNVLSNSTNVTVTGTLDLNGFTDTIGALNGAGNVTNNNNAAGLLVGGNDASGLFSGVLSGTGGLTKIGDGTQTLTGVNTYTGLTTVLDGILIVNAPGSLGGPVTVGLNGILGGTGGIGATRVEGRIAPGNSIGTLNVNGAYTQAAGSTYEAELNGAGTCDLIAATGAATIEAGTTLQLVAQPSAFGVGQRFTILTAAGGVAGTYTTLTHNFAGSFVPTLFYNPANLQVVLASNLAGTPGLTENQLTLARLLDGQSLLDPQGDLLTVLNNLSALPAAPLQDALQQVAPEEFGNTAAAGIAVGGMFQANAVRRMHDVLGLGDTWSSGAASPMSLDQIGQLLPPQEGDGAPGTAGSPPGSGRELRWGTWGMGFGGASDVDGTSEAEGFRSSTGGVSAGLDYRPDPDGVVGLMVGGAWTDVSGEGLAGDADLGSFSVGLYGGHRFDKLYANLLLAYTHHDVDTTRDILIGGVTRTAEGDHDGDEFDGNLEVGLDLGEGTFQAQPFVGLSYTGLHESGFEETGAGALNLDVDSSTTDSLRSALGVRVAWNLKSSGGVRWIPQLQARWEHQMLDSDTETSAAFPGMTGAPSFTVSGVDMNRDAAVIGAGLGARFSGSVGAFVGYEGRFGDQEVDHQGQGGIEIRW